MLYNDLLHGGLQQRHFKKGGDSSSTSYIQSPEARKVMNLLMPVVERMGVAGQWGGQVPTGYGMRTGTLWDIPSVPTMGAAPVSWDVPEAPSVGALPDYRMMMPTEETFASISPDIKEAVMAPYRETSKELQEQLMLGGGASARGGLSGQASAGLGKYWAEAAPKYTESLWGAVSPALQAGYAGEMTGWGREQDLARTAWEQDIASKQAQYGAELQKWGKMTDLDRSAWEQNVYARQFPFQAIPGMAGASMPSPMVQQGGGGKF